MKVYVESGKVKEVVDACCFYHAFVEARARVLRKNPRAAAACKFFFSETGFYSARRPRFFNAETDYLISTLTLLRMYVFEQEDGGDHPGFPDSIF